MTTKKQHQAFYENVLEYIVSLGAKNTHTGALCSRYYINTTAGRLDIYLDEPEKGEVFSIYARFENENKAALMLGNSDTRLNKYSGKWNFHSFQADYCLREFKNEIEMLIVTIPV